MKFGIALFAIILVPAAGLAQTELLRLTDARRSA